MVLTKKATDTTLIAIIKQKKDLLKVQNIKEKKVNNGTEEDSRNSSSMKSNRIIFFSHAKSYKIC